MAHIPGALPLLAVLGAVAFTLTEGVEWDSYQVVRPPGRFFHSSTTDSAGNLYVVGGISSTLHNLEIPSCLSDTWVLRRDSQQWEQLSSSDASGSEGLPPHSGASLIHVTLPPPTSIPLLLLVGGNLNYPCSTASVQPSPAGDQINHLWVMDVASGMWKVGTAYPDNENGFPLARSNAAVVAIPGGQKLIMAGGLSAANIEVLSDVWELDLSIGFGSDSRGIWRRIGDLPFPVAYGAAMYHPSAESIFIQGGLIIEEGDVEGEVAAMQQKAYDGLLEVKLLPGGSIETEEKASSGIFRMYHSGWSMQIEGMELLAVSGGSVAQVSDGGPALENSTLQLYDIQEGLWLPEDHGLLLPHDESPPAGLIGATAATLEVQAGAIVFGGMYDNGDGELLHDGSETFQFHLEEADNAYWRRLGFASPVPRVELNAVMLGESRMLIEGGCHPFCEPRIPSTLMSDLWVLNRPQDGSLGWGWLVSGLPSWGSVDARSNMWSRVVTSNENTMGPGKRMLHTLMADSETSAIFFGGAMPRVANQPVFNYEVWRLNITGEGTSGVVPGTWTMIPTTFATNPFNPFGTYRPPMIGHSATVDGDGNMLVFGGYDGTLLEQGAAEECKLTSSLWRLMLNQDPTKTSVWEELSGPSTSMNTEAAPVPRLHHTCQYLSQGSGSGQGLLWCHGGVACSNDLLGDTWGYSFEGRNWFELESGPTPGRRAGHSMVELSPTQLILTGGYSDPVKQIPRSDVWMLDASCGSRSPLWRELYPAKGVARAQHASVNLGGGLLSMVAGQVPADDPSWHVVATWNRTANAQQSVRLTNSIAVMDLASCFPTSSPCINDEAKVCSAAPYKVDAMVQLLPPSDDSLAPGSSQAPSCIVSMQNMAIVVTDEYGSVLASCNTPDDMLAGDGVTSCRWSTDSITMERTLEATGIGMRERTMPLIVEAMLGGVTVAQSQPLDVTASLTGENKLMSLMLELWKPAVLLFALMRGGQPIAGVKVTLLRCRSPEACFPAYDPEAYPDGCVPLVTNIAGTANFYIWPPLRDDAYGFRVRASVDGITYYSKRVLPELLHPNRTWQESLNIPSGITCTTNVDLSLEGINLLGTNQLIWPIVQLRLVQVATGMVIKSSLESLNSLSNTAYSTLIRSSRKVWPLKWEEEGLDVDIQSDYVVQAIAYGSQGGWILAQSRQVRSADYVSHSLTFQMELRFSLISIELGFPTCDRILNTLGELSMDCSTANLPVAGATVLVRIGPVTVSQQSYSDLLWQVRRRSSRRMMTLGSGPAAEDDEAGLVGGPSRKLLQSRQFQWEHSVGSNSLGQAKIGVFLSSQLPETTPQISLEVLYGGLPLYTVENVPRGPVADLGQIIVNTPLLCVNRVLYGSSGSFPVADLGQLVAPQRAVPPGHGCRYQIQPSWDTTSPVGYISLTIHYHLLYSSGSDEDTLVIKSVDNAGNIAERVTCRRTGCGSLRVDSNQLGSAYLHEFQNVVSVNVEFQASAVSPTDAPFRGFLIQYSAFDTPPPSAAFPPVGGPSIGPSAPSSRGRIDNQAVIEVLTAGTVSAVLLLLMICCIWKICWIRWQRQGLVGPGSEQSNGLDAYVELISNNGMQNRTAPNGEPADGNNAVQASPMGRYRRRKGVPSRVIAQIPSHVHSCSISQDGHDNSDNEQDCCSICLEDYENGVVLRTLPCMHQYHDSCILGWLQRNTTCPLCKYVIYERKERDRSHGNNDSSRTSPSSSLGSIPRMAQINRIESGNSEASISSEPSPTAVDFLIPARNSDLLLVDAERSIADGAIERLTELDSPGSLLPGSMGGRD